MSTAYYALFHALAELCARQLVGAWQPWIPFRLMYRSLDHSTARKVFDAMRKGGGFSDGAITVGETFRLLQEQRHSADYDLGYRISRAETLAWIERTRQAIDKLQALPADERKLLAVRLIGRSR